MYSPFLIPLPSNPMAKEMRQETSENISERKQELSRSTEKLSPDARTSRMEELYLKKMQRVEDRLDKLEPGVLGKAKKVAGTVVKGALVAGAGFIALRMLAPALEDQFAKVGLKRINGAFKAGGPGGRISSGTNPDRLPYSPGTGAMGGRDGEV